MKFLRSVAGSYLLDSKRYTKARNHFNVYDLNEQTENQEKNWYGHILRMNENRLAKELLNYKPEGHRAIGRP
jgi:hypothetical protein